MMQTLSALNPMALIICSRCSQYSTGMREQCTSPAMILAGGARTFQLTVRVNVFQWGESAVSCRTSFYWCLYTRVLMAASPTTSRRMFRLFISIKYMQIKYLNNRDIQEGSNFLTNFRPSATLRILSVFQSLLTYGIVYNGFGIHSYYMQKTGSSMNFGPWARMKTLGFTFGKYFAVALPFFYLKEVFFSLNYISTRDKPLLRKALDYRFVQNIFSMVAVFPLFYYFERNITKSLRGSLVIGLFAMANDLYIEKPMTWLNYKESESLKTCRPSRLSQRGVLRTREQSDKSSISLGISQRIKS